MAYEWTDMAFLELLAGNTAMIIFGLAVVMVFLVLAAQYESWSMPLAVILVVPMCLLSAVIGVRMAQMDINIFTRIGFVVLVGLASKNAILIVEFAKRKREAGESRRRATLEACRLRLRPIIMTSLAFILGVLPLMLANGAGAEMRRTLGTAVFSGMLGVTVFGIFLTPVFFATIDWLGGTPVFASKAAHFVGRNSLRLLTLEPLRHWVTRHRTPVIVIGPVKIPRKSVPPPPAPPQPAAPREPALQRLNPRCFPTFFINRPIFASVLSIIVTLAGSVALFTLPIAQYPEITPPTVEVSASYPGANAQVVADTVAAPIEQQVVGVEDMLYMSSPVHERRQLRAHGHVPQRRRFEHGPGAGAKPRGLGPADFARPGEAPRRDGEKEIAQRVDDRQFVLARRQPRQFVSEQLRHDPTQR